MISASDEDRIPLSGIERVEWLDHRAQYQSIKTEIDDAIQRVLLSGQYVQSDEVFGFEEEFSQYCNVLHGVGVHSGSDAIVLALKAWGIVEGDEVLLPDNSCMSEPNAIMLAGAIPVPVDIDERTYNINPDRLAAHIGPRTKVIHAVHAYGQPCDMLAINNLGHERDLLVIEDISLAPGTRIAGKRVGQFGDIAIASFGQGKILNAYGNGGGIVLTNSPSVADRIRDLANYGQSQFALDHVCDALTPWGGKAWVEMGYNSMLDSIQAAILRVKLRHLDEWLEKRAHCAAVYDAALKGLGVTTPFVHESVTSAYRGYLIRVANRSRILAHLRANGIEAAAHYLPPLHLQPAMSRFGYQEGAFPVTEEIATEMISLPLYPEMTEEHIEHVVRVLKCGLR